MRKGKDFMSLSSVQKKQTNIIKESIKCESKINAIREYVVSIELPDNKKKKAKKTMNDVNNNINVAEKN